jgi:hypothetical protein
LLQFFTFSFARTGVFSGGLSVKSGFKSINNFFIQAIRARCQITETLFDKSNAPVVAPLPAEPNDHQPDQELAPFWVHAG